MRKHNTSDAIIIQNAPTSSERFGHGSLEEVPILDLAIKGLGFIPNSLQTTVVKPLSTYSQGSARPAVKEICQIGIGNCVVIGRVSKPKRSAAFWKVRRPRVRLSNLPWFGETFKPILKTGSHDLHGIGKASSRLRKADRLGEIPDHRQRLASEDVLDLFLVRLVAPVAERGTPVGH